MRTRTTAAPLAFFLGGLGVHQFYLGNYIRGFLYLLFCWTYIPIFIGVLDFLILLLMKEEAFDKKYNPIKEYGGNGQNFTAYTSNKKPRIDVIETKKQTTPSRTFEDQRQAYYQRQDPNVIDVNQLGYNLKTSTTGRDINNVPYWSHTYVSSLNDLNKASANQKEYYNYFKHEFLHGRYIDIKGNSNYAFVLYFDLMQEYNIHQDIELLERQFKLLGQICPKTLNYSTSSFKELLNNRTDYYSIKKLEELRKSSYSYESNYSSYDPDSHKLGGQFKEKLKLTEQEVIWLNKFWNPANVFLSIEGCCMGVIRHYLLVIKSFDEFAAPSGSTFEKELGFFKKELKKIFSENSADYDFDYYTTKYLDKTIESAIYITIFKRVENFIRGVYGHKRKIKAEFEYSQNDIDKEFETRIGDIIEQINLHYTNEILQPDLSTKILLNAQNVNRWKDEFLKLREGFKKDNKESFLSGIDDLEVENVKNPNIENIFYEASKFIAKHDKILALKFYAKYIYYDIQSITFDHKRLTQTVEKSLFENPEHIEDFRMIIQDLIDSKDLARALAEIEIMYVPKRKKIYLDRKEIEAVAKKHSSTVELLNEYLNVEEESQPNREVEEEFDNNEEVEIVIKTIAESPYRDDLNLNKIQIELLEQMKTRSFVITQEEVDKLALENGVFKNQLIDSINDACFDILEGEPLIEEDDENYIIEKSYYQEIEK